MGRPVDLGATKTNRRWTESLAGQPALGSSIIKRDGEGGNKNSNAAGSNSLEQQLLGSTLLGARTTKSESVSQQEERHR